MALVSAMIAVGFAYSLDRRREVEVLGKLRPKLGGFRRGGGGGGKKEGREEKSKLISS